jgi:chromosome segregation ATPase
VLNLETARRYQAALEAARTVINTLEAARLEVAGYVAAAVALVETKANAPTWRQEELAHDDAALASARTDLKSRKREIDRELRKAQAHLKSLEAERPAITAALLQGLLEDASADYHFARSDFEAAADRLKVLREALLTWNPAAEVAPASAARLNTRSLRDVLYQERQRLAGLGIRLPLFPGEPFPDA